MAPQVKGIDGMDVATTNRIRTMIKNRQGLGGGLYIPNDAFHTLVKEQVGLTEAPCLELARDGKRFACGPLILATCASPSQCTCSSQYATPKYLIT